MVIHGKPEQRSPHLENIPAVAYRRTVGPGSILTFCNEYTRELFGYLPEELTEEPSMPFYRLLHPGDRERIINELEQVNQRGDEFHLQYRMLTRDKQTVRVSDRGRIIPSKSNESRAYEGIITPRSDPAQVDSLSGNEIVRTDGSQNKYDFLTGLPNRPWFLEQVENRIQEVLGGKRPFDHFSLVLLDLDNFQRVNDFFGRSVGDSVIEKMGALVESSFDDRAITGRIGSSRFGCFFPHEHSEEPTDLIKKRMEDFSRTIKTKNVEITQEFSVGVARFPEDGVDLETLIKAANQALDRAKSRLDHPVAVFSESDRVRLRTRSDERNLILRAWDEDRIEIHYQPIVHVPTYEIVMYEALLRVQREEGSPLTVKDFEEVIHNGRITRPLDRLIFEKSLEECSAKIGNDCNLKLAVNLFPSSVIDPGCFERINRTVENYDFPSDRLVIEIPETLMLSHWERAIENIERASEKFSFQFALDDFGVGHGSFNLLNNLPIDYLKIDGTFVQDLASNGVERKFVEMTAGLSSLMDLKVIGEWIETEDTAELLRERGVPYHQGYYYAHPFPFGLGKDSSRIRPDF